MSNKKLFYSIFAVIAVLASLGFWYFQRNVFSKEVLKLEIIGPESFEAGEAVNYTLKYKNNGEIILASPRLIFEYPSFSLEENNKLRQERNLEDIYPGQEKTIIFSSRILGKEGEMKIAKAWLEFQPKNLKAKYEVSTTQTARIKFSPLTFEFDLPSKIETGKDFSFSLNYFSNIDYPLSQLRARIAYPAGFEYISSEPAALESDEWEIPLLNKAQGGRIKVIGRINGNIGEQMVFKAFLGIWQEGEFLALKETAKGTEIAQPNIYLSQLVNNSADFVANPGDSLHYEIFFKNVGNSVFENLFLVARLDGSLFDFDSLRAEGASFHQGDNSLIWDWKKNPQLKLLDEDEEGLVDFWINVKGISDLRTQNNKNPVLKNRASISLASDEFTIKVNSKLDLSQQVFFDDEAFGNTGPLPPKFGEATTYTIIWRLKNFFNDVKEVKVKAVLPSKMALTGQLLPRDASFVFDSQSREIIWNAGEMLAFEGVAGEAGVLAFQVSFTPDSSQIGQTPDLMGRAEVFGQDTWTQEVLQAEAPALNTGSLGDIEFTKEKGIVR